MYCVDIETNFFPFDNNYFDAIYCGKVIEHLYNPGHLLEEIYRVLKPSGIYVITTPNLTYWLNRIILLFGFQPYLTEVSLKWNVGKFRANIHDVCGHIRSFTNKSLKELLELNHFKIVKMVRSDVMDALPLLIKAWESFFHYSHL